VMGQSVLHIDSRVERGNDRVVVIEMTELWCWGMTELE
jgi:hypothetical protein